MALKHIADKMIPTFQKNLNSEKTDQASHEIFNPQY